jgi:uncharacterized protein YjbI with pentapeptide repeats
VVGLVLARPALVATDVGWLTWFGIGAVPTLVVLVGAGLLMRAAWGVWAGTAARVEVMRRRADEVVVAAGQFGLIRDRLAAERDRLALEKDLLQAQNAVRTTLVQLFAGVAQLVLGSAVIGTLLFQWQNAQIADRNAGIAQDNLTLLRQEQAQNAQIADRNAGIAHDNLKLVQKEQAQRAQSAEEAQESARRTVALSEQGQVAERFTRAIEQLGSTASDGSARPEIRLGGIYALERIANDSKQDRQAIMDVLSTLVRREAQGPQRLDARGCAEYDRKVRTPEEGQVRQRTDAVLQLTLRALGRLNRVHWDELAKRGIAPIDEPTVGNDVRKTDLSKTDLQGFNLTGIDLVGAYLQDADLAGTTLRLANLQDADLRCAHLEAASLQGADLRRADLTGAHLRGANFEGAQNLTSAQILQAREKGKGALLPKPPQWTEEQGAAVRRQW